MKSQYLTRMWNARDCGVSNNELSLTTKWQSSSKDSNTLYMFGFDGSSLLEVSKESNDWTNTVLN